MLGHSALHGSTSTPASANGETSSSPPVAYQISLQVAATDKAAVAAHVSALRIPTKEGTWPSIRRKAAAHRQVQSPRSESVKQETNNFSLDNKMQPHRIHMGIYYREKKFLPVATNKLSYWPSLEEEQSAAATGTHLQVYAAGRSKMRRGSRIRSHP